jgi:chromosome segregation ATPase
MRRDLKMSRIFDSLSGPWKGFAAQVTERLDNQRDRLDRQRERLDKQRERLNATTKETANLRRHADRQQLAIERLQKSVADLRGALAPFAKEQRTREVDYVRAIQQLGVLETRLGRLEERLEPDRYDADGPELAEARSLVDTVRREHDQARVRFQVISAYEERLRRLEAAVVEMYDGDIRNPF